MAKQTKTNNYTLPTKPELEDAYQALWATLKNKFGPEIEDDEELKAKYQQIINKNKPVTKFTLRDMLQK